MFHVTSGTIFRVGIRNIIGDSFADECAKVDVAVARGAKQQAAPEAVFQTPQVVYPSLQQNPVLLNTRHDTTVQIRGYFSHTV